MSNGTKKKQCPLPEKGEAIQRNQKKCLLSDKIVHEDVPQNNMNKEGQHSLFHVLDGPFLGDESILEDGPVLEDVPWNQESRSPWLGTLGDGVIEQTSENDSEDK